MSSWRSAVAAAWLAALAGAAFAQTSAADRYPGIGRAATPAEIAAWDIDVRPDFSGLPAGRGSVARGQEIWEARCASCHGYFGESNAFFAPLVGGTSAADIESGRTARLADPAYPQRTMMMKLANLSTLWDYIRRAMPWTQPKSMTPDEVYAVTAYLLHLGGVLPEQGELSDRNIAAVQQRLPNRNGLSTDHGLWPGRGLGNGGRPDVKATACMQGCSGEPRIASSLPDHARNSHGNLALQNRLVGAQRGADTATAGSPAAAMAALADPAALALARKHNCLACHGAEQRVVGPGFSEVARRYASRADAAGYLLARIAGGGSGVWGDVAMPAQSLPNDDARAIAQWLAAGAPR